MWWIEGPPLLSADGRWLLVNWWIRDTQPPFGILPADTQRFDRGALRPLDAVFTADDSPALSPDGSTVAFTFYDDPFGLTLADVTTGQPRLLHGKFDDYLSATFSPDGTRLAFIAIDGFFTYTYNIYVLDDWRAGQTPPRPLLKGDFYLVRWSPTDAHLLAVMGYTGADYTLGLVDVRDGTWRELLRVDWTYVTDMNTLSWSPDGRYLLTNALAGHSASPYRLLAVDVVTGEARWLTYGFFNLAWGLWLPAPG